MSSLTVQDLQNEENFFLIAGPCVIESEEHILKMAKNLHEITKKLNIKLIFKASFDKANRTSVHSYRGVGLTEGLRILQKVKDTFNIPILTDIHESSQAEAIGKVADIIQIPAFLCRQTDLLVATAKTGKIVNIKKGQFCSPLTMKHSVEKCEHVGCHDTIVTDRGTMFGYEDLVVDFRNLPNMKKLCPNSLVVMDCTHSLQQPNRGNFTHGTRDLVPLMCKCAIVAGCDGLFMEIHDDPENALSDATTQFNLKNTETLLNKLLVLYRVNKNYDDAIITV